MSNQPVVPVILGQDPLIVYYASDSPVTDPALTANLVCRVVLGTLASIICLVPLRILHKNGEFAATVFITTTVIKNLLTIINALIWHDNDFENWWPGYGFCDVHPYIQHFISMLFITCQLAIVRNVAHQVGLLRANPLTAREKRRRNLVQALIMFPLPVLQVVLTWLLTYQRYAVGALIGCAWTGYPTWVYIVFFLVPPLVAAIITAGYAVLTYFRYRELAKTTGAALSSNRRASDRAQRTRRRLYLMVVSVLIPFLPVVITLTVLNVRDLKELLPYDYDAIHHHTEPAPWNTILYLHSDKMDFALLNIAWIPILSAIPIFGFFGTTKDALNDYRRLLLVFGLGKIFPRLYQEYDPDRRAGGSSNGSGYFASTTSGTGKSPHKVISLTSSFRMFTKNSSRGGRSAHHELQSIEATAVSRDLEAGRGQAPPSKAAVPSSDRIVEIPHRNPWLMRTHLNFPAIPFPSFSSKPKNSKDRVDSPSQISLNKFSTPPGQTSPPIRTRVWHEESGKAAGQSGVQRGDGGDDDDARSVASAQGVIVETYLVSESHPSEGQR